MWHYRVAQVLLTLGTLEFFGPIVRDSGSSHLLNPAWVGHARFHLMWKMCFLAMCGLINMYFIWFRRPRDMESLYLAWSFQGCLVFGFWAAVILEKVYGGALHDHSFHVMVMGLNENIVAFIFFGTLSLFSLVYLRFWTGPSVLQAEQAA